MFSACVWRLALLVFVLAVVSGCGYHTVNSAVHLPGNVRTLAIPAFKNNTQSYHHPGGLTEAVIREFTSRSSYRIVSGEMRTRTRRCAERLRVS